MQKKYLLIKEIVATYKPKGEILWARRYSVATEMPKELAEWQRSATVVNEADTIEELYTYFN